MIDFFKQVSKFVDFAGKEHYFVVVVMKKNLRRGIDYVEDSEEGMVMRSGVSIGTSVCNPIDEFNEEIGFNKAHARAEKSIPVFYAAYSSMITNKMLEECAMQEVEYIKHHPEKYVKGYLQAKDKFKAYKAAKAIENSLTDEEKNIIESIKKDPHYLDNVNAYLEWWRKQ